MAQETKGLFPSLLEEASCAIGICAMRTDSLCKGPVFYDCYYRVSDLGCGKSFCEVHWEEHRLKIKDRVCQDFTRGGDTSYEICSSCTRRIYAVTEYPIFACAVCIRLVCAHCVSGRSSLEKRWLCPDHNRF